MASLHVQRPHDGGGILRRLVVQVDGREVARLKQGEFADVPLPPGKHTVRGSMDWTSSPELQIDLAEDEQARAGVALPISALWNMLRRPRAALAIRRSWDGRTVPEWAAQGHRQRSRRT
ncbi:hypothetical protein GCM10028783_17850 [Modestobacter muralis]